MIGSNLVVVYNIEVINQKQQIFQEMVLGILVYAVVLGFFEEYTDILNTWSYSITFMAAVVLQILTFLTFWLKKRVVKHFKGKEGKKYVAMMVFGVWLILFLSKFVFLAVLDVVFGSLVEISGFVGLLIIIASMTIATRLIGWFYRKLARA